MNGMCTEYFKIYIYISPNKHSHINTRPVNTQCFRMKKINKTQRDRKRERDKMKEVYPMKETKQKHKTKKFLY